MRFILLASALNLMSAFGWAQIDDADSSSTTSLALADGTETQIVDVNVAMDGQAFHEYWNGIFDELFAFADVDQSGTITDDEVHLLPSPRAMRLVLGSGFTPPVANLHSVREFVDDAKGVCTREDVRRGYRAAGVGCVQIGRGELPHTDALTKAFVDALDDDRSGGLSQQELSMAELSLRKLDTNDDELISAVELVPNQIYPGCAGTNPVDLPANHERSAIQTGMGCWIAQLPPAGATRAAFLRQLQNATKTNRGTTDPLSWTHRSWNISLSEMNGNKSLAVPCNADLRYETWSVPGPLPKLFHEFAQRITEATAAQRQAETSVVAIKEATDGERNDEFAWLIPMVDRDFSGDASADEIATWLKIQGKIAHGQLLISVLTGGGLFERLDQNHDAGLSVRELRNAWNVLRAASCTTGNHVDCERMPSLIMMIASRGYPAQITKPNPNKFEWFHLMDRNSDGDISRREFTEATEYFTQLDRDHDDLISANEAEMAQD